MNHAIRNGHNENTIIAELFLKSVHQKAAKEKLYTYELEKIKQLPGPEVGIKGLAFYHAVEWITRLKTVGGREEQDDGHHDHKKQKVNLVILKEVANFQSVIRGLLF